MGVGGGGDAIKGEGRTAPIEKEIVKPIGKVMRSSVTAPFQCACPGSKKPGQCTHELALSRSTANHTAPAPPCDQRATGFLPGLVPGTGPSRWMP